MKRAATVVIMLGLTTFVFAHQASSPQNPPAAQTGTKQPGAAQPSQGQQATPQPSAATVPAVGKRPPQAKTDAEFAAFNAAIANTNDSAAVEKAADDFATKYPDSELRACCTRLPCRVISAPTMPTK